MKKYIILVLILIAVIGCDKDVYVTPPLEAPANGYAFINSIPSGATIFINGKNSGKVTPDSITYMEYGVFTLTLKKEGFYDSVFTAVFTKDVKNTFSIDFTKNPRMLGSINFTSNPAGAEIFINDSSISKLTPFKLNGIIPGSYVVKCKKVGFRDAESVVKVNSGNIAPAYITLQDTTKWVDYKTTNSGIATNEINCIEIDGNNKIWVGTEGKGISVFNSSTWVNYSTANSLCPSDKIVCIKKDNSGSILIGTDKGFVRYIFGNWEIYNTNNSNLPNNHILDIAVNNNEIWIATKSGLVKFEDGNFVVYNTGNSALPDNWITAIGFNNNGVLYVGTYSAGIV